MGFSLARPGLLAGLNALTGSIESHDIDLVLTENSSFSTTKINSLATGKFEWNFRHVIFKQILVIDSWRICCEIAVIRMSLDFTDDQSTLVQVMAWCRQAPSHYLSHCWPRSLSPYGIARPQWVNKWYQLIDHELMHWGSDKMVAIFQTIFSNAFYSMKILVFWLKFHQGLFLMVQSTICQHWFR